MTGGGLDSTTPAHGILGVAAALPQPVLVDILLGPDVFVNASVALGSAPEKVVQRVLGRHKGETKTSEWVLSSVRSMLSRLPAFRAEAVEGQIAVIRGFVEVVDVPGEFGPSAWEEALVALAKVAGVTRIVTDHPDLLEHGSSDGIEFVSTEGWLLEFTMPPPPP